MARSGFAIALVLATATSASGAWAQTATLHGRVASAQEGALEGVLVSARKDGSTMTTTVVSDEKGDYAFPAGRLPPGHYTIQIRASGYDLASPSAVDVPATGAKTQDIALRPTHNLSAQLTSAEWMMSMPATDAQRHALYGCTSCHTLERIVRSTYTADDFMQKILPLMADFSSQAFPLDPQVRKVPRDIKRAFSPQVAQLADFLADINLSKQQTWSYPLKTLPRPTGRATHVIITEYDLPRKTIQPHDVIGAFGHIWFADFGEDEIGRLDPSTGAVQEFKYPASRPGYAKGNLDLEIGADNKIYVGMMNQTGFAVFDPSKKTFSLHPLPANMLNDSTQQAMVVPTASAVDGNVWYNDAETVQVGRMNLKTGEFSPWIAPYKDFPKGRHSLYGIYADSDNNAWFCDFSGEAIGRIDAKTSKVTLYPTPTRRSRPRRGRMDAQNRLWFAEWQAGQVGMFDTKTHQFKEWPVPTPYSAPYDAVADRYGDVWTAGMNDDRVTRIDTKTGEATEYLLPRETNSRRVYVDNAGPRPVFWTGSNHGASIVKVEPLD